MLQAGKHFIAIASLLSFAIFLSIFAATFVSRPALEGTMNAFVRERVHQEVRERLGSLAGADTTALQRWYQDSATSAADFLETDYEPLVDSVLDSLSYTHGDDSPKVARARSFAEMGRDVLQARVDSRVAISAQLEAFIRGKYAELVSALISEIRIFSGLNAALFAFVLALLAAKWSDPKVVFLPAILLLAATVTCALFYIFNQNWFLAVFLQDYAGYGYLTYVTVVFAFLADVAFNQARATRAIIDAIGTAFSSA